MDEATVRAGDFWLLGRSQAALLNLIRNARHFGRVDGGIGQSDRAAIAPVRNGGMTGYGGVPELPTSDFHFALRFLSWRRALVRPGRYPWFARPRSPAGWPLDGFATEW